MNKLNELPSLPDQECLERIKAAVSACQNLIKTCLGDDNPDRDYDYFEVILHLSLNALTAASRLGGAISVEVAQTYFEQINSRIRPASKTTHQRLHG